MKNHFARYTAGYTSWKIKIEIQNQCVEGR